MKTPWQWLYDDQKRERMTGYFVIALILLCELVQVGLLWLILSAVSE